MEFLQKMRFVVEMVALMGRHSGAVMENNFKKEPPPEKSLVAWAAVICLRKNCICSYGYYLAFCAFVWFLFSFNLVQQI